MRKWLLFLIAGASLSGCAAAPVNPWDGITVTDTPATAPLDCGSFPYPTEIIGATIVYDTAGANDLEAYRACSEDNAGIAKAHSEQIRELRTATRALVEAGQAQRNIAEMRREMLEDERKHNAYTSIGYWVVILALGAAL